MPAYGAGPTYLPRSGGGYVGGGNPYFNVGNAYGSPYGTPGGFLSTPLGQIGANLDPATYYQRITSPYGGGIADNFSRFVQQQQARILSGLDQARLTNPNLNATDYLGGVANYDQFLRQWRNTDARGRGEAWQAFPRTRSLGY